ncbi:hypothetical protein RhiirA1_463546 [Rhizophagus irregularis]|uniref:Uncharacterized protein n=1 Tax=Rhizophagus irregularis TaxID=588596 RepID=A0A2I1FF60_9GLOM|nr:hypothetical protein RhiirA1_463546 [Rhizophagus irregularis]PKY33004.1 hypothetical protein RhiirB3_451598 [Rhizophagus irregularis]GBC16642.2 hypothetical protein RIR_jg32517.t1 [Rhizophagus irregularis DAOM 181602=DAOM 197198]CAB4478734.1 unnamed protein product [Rhizophagus irregularis]CAB5318636.1 unnamed protein product [Rhizophagus irregularis]
MGSTEDIERSNFEGLENIFNNLPEANKNLEMEDQNKLLSKEDFITGLRSQRATIKTSNPSFANDEQHLEAMGNQMTSKVSSNKVIYPHGSVKEELWYSYKYNKLNAEFTEGKSQTS